MMDLFAPDVLNLPFSFVSTGKKVAGGTFRNGVQDVLIDICLAFYCGPL
jgi:hypothetical protein